MLASNGSTMNLKEFLHPVNLRIDSRRKLEEYFHEYLKEDMDVYDIGCGSKPFSDFFAEEKKIKNYLGVDIENGFYDSSYIDVFGTAYDIPIEEGSADAVISSQLLEHLDNPIDSFKETHRVLKKDGVFFLSYPFLYPIHAAPHDYMRYTEYFTIKHLEENGFEIVDTWRLGGFWYCVGLFTGIYVQALDRGVLKKLKIAKILSVSIRWIFKQMHLLETGLLKILKKNPSDFQKNWTVNYIFIAKKK